MKRPKFQRKPADQIAERFIEYSSVTDLEGEYMDVPAFLTEDDESTQEVLNYGLDISILVAMIAKGQL